jgi:hypothetical protein
VTWCCSDKTKFHPFTFGMTVELVYFSTIILIFYFFQSQQSYSIIQRFFMANNNPRKKVIKLVHSHGGTRKTGENTFQFPPVEPIPSRKFLPSQSSNSFSTSYIVPILRVIRLAYQAHFSLPILFPSPSQYETREKKINWLLSKGGKPFPLLYFLRPSHQNNTKAKRERRANDRGSAWQTQKGPHDQIISLQKEKKNPFFSSLKKENGLKENAPSLSRPADPETGVAIWGWGRNSLCFVTCNHAYSKKACGGVNAKYYI